MFNNVLLVKILASDRCALPTKIHYVWHSKTEAPIIRFDCQIIQWSTKIATLKRLPIRCIVYTVDDNYELILQLSAFDRDMLALNMHPEQTFSAQSMTTWFQQVPIQIQGTEFHPQLVDNCQ